MNSAAVKILEKNADCDEDAIIVLPVVNTQYVAVDTTCNNSSKGAILVNCSHEPNYESGAEQNVLNDNVSSTYWMKTLKQNYAKKKEVLLVPVHQIQALKKVRIVSLI